jgi:hypothetical protein
MEEMFGDTDPDDMRSWMEAMPAMIGQCCATMDAQEMGSMMEEWMPKMMGSCFSMMDAEQREEMFSMCRQVLDQFEAQGPAQEA